MEEKRRCHRLKMQLSACYQASKLQKNMTIATTLDLSAIGMCLLSKEKLEVGQELPMQVTLPDDEKITVHIKVVWIEAVQTLVTTEYKMGVKIVEPMKADEKRFVQFYAREFLTISVQK